MVGVIYGALLAVGQNDLKRLVSYTSIAHFGFIGLGIFAFTTQAFSGAVLYMVNHGITTGMLFIAVGMVISRGNSRLISDYGGLAKATPALAGAFLIAGLASLALPGTNSFVSEFLVLLGSYPREPGLHDHRHGRHHLRRPLRAVGLPAGIPGPGARQRGARLDERSRHGRCAGQAGAC